MDERLGNWFGSQSSNCCVKIDFCKAMIEVLGLLNKARKFCDCCQSTASNRVSKEKVKLENRIVSGQEEGKSNLFFIRDFKGEKIFVSWEVEGEHVWRIYNSRGNATLLIIYKIWSCVNFFECKICEIWIATDRAFIMAGFKTECPVT